MILIKFKVSINIVFLKSKRQTLVDNETILNERIDFFENENRELLKKNSDLEKEIDLKEVECSELVIYFLMFFV
jgi:hypothetical protein